MALLRLAMNWEKPISLNCQEGLQEDSRDPTFNFDSSGSEFVVAFPVVEHLCMEEHKALPPVLLSDQHDQSPLGTQLSPESAS